VLLSDFGIATISHNTSSLNVGNEGASGTLAYMAPEQIEGHPRSASDQYALGIVVYEWLCGERPFEGSASEVMAQHLSVPPPPLRERVPTIPAQVEQVVLRALTKDPKARFASVADFAKALEQASQSALTPTAQLASEHPVLSSAAATGYDTVAVAPGHPVSPTESTPSADLPVVALEPTMYPGSPVPKSLDTPQSGATPETPQHGQVLAPTVAVVSPPLEPTMPVQRKTRRVSRKSAALLFGLVVVIIAGGILGGLSLLAHFGVTSTHSNTSALTPIRGGTWTIEGFGDPSSLLTNTDGEGIEEALYLPLFDEDAQGGIYPEAATEVPTVQNGGISANGKTWTFHLRPHLVWSDGQPYDARDVDYTWKLWLNPQYGASNIEGVSQISSATVSADHLSITFHLKQAYAPFLGEWVGGYYAPLPAHHFSAMSPQAILKSPDNLNPSVTSGPFMMAESVPSDHYTVVRNPRYYLASQGLPYLDKIIFRPADANTVLKDLQAGAIDDTSEGDVSMAQEYKRLSNYRLVYPPADNEFEGIFFNFHNQVLASHLEVRQAMAMAVDQQTLITVARQGFANPLCTDHPSFYHPGYQPDADCPDFNPAAANKLLDDSGWVKGPDGVRSKDGQRLEFEYSSTTTISAWRSATEAIVQRDFQAIGIKLDIQNYPYGIFFGSFLPGGKASPPTGAVAGRYDIAEFAENWVVDPDDSSMLACDQIPSAANNYGGGNLDFYCNHDLDALYTQELATVDAGARQQIFDQIHEIYLTQFPFIALYSWSPLRIVRKGIHNFLPSAEIDTLNIAEWWCDKGKC